MPENTAASVDSTPVAGGTEADTAESGLPQDDQPTREDSGQAAIEAAMRAAEEAVTQAVKDMAVGSSSH